MKSATGKDCMSKGAKHGLTLDRWMISQALSVGKGQRSSIGRGKRSPVQYRRGASVCDKRTQPWA